MAQAQTVAEMLGASTDAQPSGTPAPPPGFQIQDQPPPPPPGFVAAPAQPTGTPKTIGRGLGLGSRALLEGIPSVADIPANALIGAANLAYAPIGAVTKALGGTPERPLDYSPFERAGSDVADIAGLPKPQDASERVQQAIAKGIVSGMTGSGAAGLASKGLAGSAKTVAEMLAQAPVAQTVGSGAAGGAAQSVAEAGGGPLAQLGAGTVAAMVGGGAAGAVGGEFRSPNIARVAEKYGAPAAEAVSRVPEEVAVTAKGALTDEGKELAAQSGLHPEQLKQAYQEAARPPEPEAPVPLAVGDPAVWKSADADHPVQIAGEPIQTADGRSYTPVTDDAGSQTHVPTEQLQAASQAAPPAAVAAPQPVTVQPSAQARFTQAASEGVPLTRGQASQDFDAQMRENVLRDQEGPQGEQTRQFFRDQQGKIQDAIGRFQEAFGSPDATAEQRGGIVQEAVRDLRDSGKAGVSALYTQAQKIADDLGDTNITQLDTKPILDKMREIFVDEAVDAKVRNALRQQAAKYGLIGEQPRTVEGYTTVKLRDSEGELVSGPTFQGPQVRLTLANAEDLRKVVNSLYDADSTHAAQGLKPLIDNAVSGAMERAATEGRGDVGKAFKAARDAHAQQQSTFKNADIVQQLSSWKRGSRDTPAIQPEAVIGKVFGTGPDAVTSLKKVKAVLLSKPTEKSAAAWKAIQAHGVASIFDKALVLNSNAGDGLLGTVSGAKLNTAISKFGTDKLKVLLDQKDYDQLMKLRRVIGDATIPINRTVNTSNTASMLFRFLAHKGAELAGLARVVPIARSVIKGSEEIAAQREAKATLKGVTAYRPETDPAKAEHDIRELMTAANANTALGPILIASANENQP